MATTKERVHTYLVIKNAGGAERIIVWDTQDVSLGRSGENDVAIDDEAISRRHAAFYRAGNAWAVKDMGTSNGTHVNGEAIRERALANKDVIRIGDVEITFVQVAKNPASIGKPVEYASQLKNFGGAAGQATNGEATMLGLMQTVGDDDDEEDFVVGRANEFSADLDSMQEPASRAVPRDLDLELGLGGDALPPPKTAPRPAAAQPRPAPAKAAPRLAPPQPDWSLDEVAEAPAAAKPQPQPQSRPAPRAAPRAATPAAAPAPARPAAASAAPAAASLSLQLEISGLSADLQRLLESLEGKLIELPALRIRVKRDDLG
jgi:predicted component of type VI protein secretion system